MSVSPAELREKAKHVGTLHAAGERLRSDMGESNGLHARIELDAAIRDWPTDRIIRCLDLELDGLRKDLIAAIPKWKAEA